VAALESHQIVGDPRENRPSSSSFSPNRGRRSLSSTRLTWLWRCERRFCHSFLFLFLSFFPKHSVFWLEFGLSVDTDQQSLVWGIGFWDLGMEFGLCRSLCFYPFLARSSVCRIPGFFFLFSATACRLPFYTSVQQRIPGF